MITRRIRRLIFSAKKTSNVLTIVSQEMRALVTSQRTRELFVGLIGIALWWHWTTGMRCSCQPFQWCSF